MKIISVPLTIELQENLAAYAAAVDLEPAEAAKKLLIEMLGLYEDQAFVELAEQREKKSGKRVPHAKAWKV